MARAGPSALRLSTVALLAAALVGGLACAPPESLPHPHRPARAAHTLPPPDPDPRILVRLAPSADPTSAPTLHRLVRTVGARAVGPAWRIPPDRRPERGRWLRLGLSPSADPHGALARARALSEVEVAQFEYVYSFDRRPNDPLYASQWAHAFVDSEGAWRRSVGGHEVVAAVIGTGVDVDHPDLAANVWTNPAEIAGTGQDDAGNGYVDDVHGFDFALGLGDLTPSGSHETQVAGVLGAVGDNGIGVAGMAWDVSIMVLQVEPRSSQVAEAIHYAVDNGADVLNMSFSSHDPGVYGPDAIVAEALEAAEAADVVVVASAGNDARAARKYPAAVSTVVGVAALAPDATLAPFSNFGEWVSLSAPGVDIVTTDLGGGTWVVEGTSYAAPLVAGVVVLMRALDPSLSAAEIRRILTATGSSPGGDVPIGRRLDAAAALTLPDVPAEATPFAASFWSAGGNDWWIEVEVSANEVLAGVDARVGDTAWHPLSPTTQWTWAESVHVPDGALVQFRARSAETGGVVRSGRFRWPEGERISDPEPPDVSEEEEEAEEHPPDDAPAGSDAEDDPPSDDPAEVARCGAGTSAAAVLLLALTYRRRRRASGGRWISCPPDRAGPPRPDHPPRARG